MTAPAPLGLNVNNNHIAKRAPSRHDNTLAKATAAARPMPVAAPVMRTTLPLKSRKLPVADVIEILLWELGWSVTSGLPRAGDPGTMSIQPAGHAAVVALGPTLPSFAASSTVL